MPECKKCDSHFPNRVKIEGKVRVLKNRKYCLDCSPFGQHNTRKLEKLPLSTDNKICPRCGKEKDASQFYKKGDKPGSYCKPCHNTYSHERWKKRKKDAVEYLGGKCEDCEKQYPFFVYDFHHTGGKDYEWGQLRLRAWDSVIKELDRCVLLCSNCHRIRHYG